VIKGGTLLRSGTFLSRWLRSWLALVIAVGALVGVLGTTAAGSPRTAGLSDDEIRIGIIHTKGAEQAAASVGAPGALIDFKAAFQTLIDDINDNGGVLGRKLVPVFFAFNPTSPVPIQEEAACTLFTQDDPVFAALISNVHSDTLLNCLGDAHVITVAAPGVSYDDAATYKAHPELVSAGSFDLTRSMSVLVNGLVKAKFFDKGAKIGVIHSDEPKYVAAVAVLKKQLAKVGLEITADVASTPGDLAALMAGAQAGVLKFSSAGIDHVLNIGLNGPGTFLFMRQAESQGYSPQYGLSSFDEPSGLTGVATPEALEQTAGVGWFLANDVASPEVSAAGQHCLDLVAAQGGNLSSSYSVVAVLGYCDQLNIFKAALEAGGKTPSLKSFLRGLASLGKKAPESASLLGPLSYSKSRKDGATTAQLLAYDAGCDCFSYTGKPFTVK
jgi:ABC-type branched-subunit amino acid transport system substrate-binding protein